MDAFYYDVPLDYINDPDDLVNRTDTVLRCQSSLVPVLLYTSIGPAVFIVCLLSFLRKRSKRCLSCCHGRPAIVEPINMLDQYDNRWTYGAIFGAIPNLLVSVFLGFDGKYFWQDDFPTYLKSLFTILYVQVVGLSFFPLFACLNTDFKLTGSVIGFLYSFYWVSIKTQGMLECINPYPELYTNVTLVVNLPSNICLGVVTVRYLLVTVDNIKNKTWAKYDLGIRIAPKHMILYVKKLLSKPAKVEGEENENPSVPNMIKCKIKTMFKLNFYDKDLPFKHSPRIICTFSATLICTYLLGSLHFWICANFLQALRDYVEEFNNATDDAFKNRTFIGRNIEDIYYMIECEYYKKYVTECDYTEENERSGDFKFFVAVN